MHAGKRFKALIDSGAALSLAHTSIYNIIENCYKAKILPAAVNLKTADGSSMSSLGKAMLHLHTANFKFSHTLIMCDKLPDTLYQDLQTATLHCSNEISLKKPPRHNSIIPITIKGHNLKAPVRYFISNQHINRTLDPSFHVIDGIYNIKDKLTLHVLVANYTNKCITFNKGQCIGHTETSIDHMPQTSLNNLTTQKMINKHSQPDSFTHPLHTLLCDVRKSLNQLLETFKLQFAQDETSTETTHLTKMQIDTGDSEPVLQRP